MVHMTSWILLVGDPIGRDPTKGCPLQVTSGNTFLECFYCNFVNQVKQTTIFLTLLNIFCTKHASIKEKIPLTLALLQIKPTRLIDNNALFRGKKELAYQLP